MFKKMTAALAALMIAAAAVMPMTGACAEEADDDSDTAVVEEQAADTGDTDEAEYPPVGVTADDPEAESPAPGVTDEDTATDDAEYPPVGVPADDPEAESPAPGVTDEDTATDEAEYPPVGVTADDPTAESPAPGVTSDDTVVLTAPTTPVATEETDGTLNVTLSSGTMYMYAANGGAVNVRTLPSKAGKVMVQLGVGFPVTVVKYDAGWSRVTVLVNGRTYNGYVASEFLIASDPTAWAQSFQILSVAARATVRPSRSTGYVNLRSEASTSSSVIRTMRSGERLTLLAASNAWYRVADAYGNVGYVVKGYVKR